MLFRVTIGFFGSLNGFIFIVVLFGNKIKNVLSVLHYGVRKVLTRIITDLFKFFLQDIDILIIDDFGLLSIARRVVF